ncbi:MAG: hypothetical protein EU548_02805 [Promethearchaeota archaeon]|nr:MAG: hypothetical protein EU548_02805 [Candidatus Lokiarchaeota archaeon]
MILTNLRILKNGKLRDVTILIRDGIIDKLIISDSSAKITELREKYKNENIIDCLGKIAIPGIIDIHSHLRDLHQSDKETFLTGTNAAAFSGITTVFNMPNTKPPANTVENVQKWMDYAENSLYIDVYFIAGIPDGINIIEIENILKLGVIGFKIYPHSPICNVDWMNPENFKKILEISSKYNTHIFIHAEWPIDQNEKEKIKKNYFSEGYTILKYHSNLHPPKSEAKFVSYALENYKFFILDKNLKKKEFPSLHFCHISCEESYKLLREFKGQNPDFKISFEVTPHHLLLSNEIILNNFNFGKVLPPLRDKSSQKFLYNELRSKNIQFIGTDHAPHTLKEKDLPFNSAPSGFPGFETYPLTMLNKVCQYDLSLENFIRISSWNPSIRFNLKEKGLIEEGYEANLLIIDKISEYSISSETFKSKAKFSPFEGFKTFVQIWKVFLRGKQINVKNKSPMGRIMVV